MNGLRSYDVADLVKHLLRLAALAAVLTGTLMVPATSHAAPPVAARSVVLSKQTVNDMDYIVSEITIPPNGSTGWHTHQGVVFGIVRSGTLTHYGSDCHQDGIYGAGTPITDPVGRDHVHLGRNEGTVPVVLLVTYVDTAGSPTSDGAPNPGCALD